jgi:hypothetical protein
MNHPYPEDTPFLHGYYHPHTPVCKLTHAYNECYGRPTTVAPFSWMIHPLLLLTLSSHFMDETNSRMEMTNDYRRLFGWMRSPFGLSHLPIIIVMFLFTYLLLWFSGLKGT